LEKIKLANILILSLVYPPDGASTANIIGGLAEGFAKAGHEVCVITSTPHYNIDREASIPIILRKYFLNLIYKSMNGRIRVYHIWMPRKSKNKFLRAVEWGWFCIVATLLPIFLINKIDFVFCCSPPLSIGLSADLISRAKGIPFVYNVQEIYPDIAVLSGQLKNKLIIRAFIAIEKYIYSRAAHIIVIGQRMREKLLSKGVQERKQTVVPNFVDTTFFYKKKEGFFRKKFNLDSKFVFGYAGNFGIAQEIGPIIELARRLKNQDDVHFLLAGSGINYGECLRNIKKSNLSNITMIGYQSYKYMPDFYASVDILFVSLRSDLAQTAFPSKTMEIMACGKPIIALTSEKSDLADIIKEAKCGFVIDPINIDMLHDIVIKCLNNEFDIVSMGRNGLKYVINNLSKEIILKKYLEIISKCT